MLLVRLFILLTVNSLVFFSCKTKFSDTGKIYTIRFQPTEGLTASYSIISDITIGQELTKEKAESRNTTESRLFYEFLKGSNTGFLLNTTYERFRTVIITADEEKKIDAATASKSDDPSEQIFALFHNKKFTALLDSNGKVQKIEGIDDLLNKIKEATKYGGTAAGQSFINEDFFKKAITTGTSFYPGKPVKTGDTWITEQLIDESLQITTKRTLKLNEINGDIATIKITGVVVNDNAGMKVNGQQVNISFDGGEDGYVKIDLRTGLIVKSKISASGDGAITVMNRSVPITFQSTIEIEKKK